MRELSGIWLIVTLALASSVHASQPFSEPVGVVYWKLAFGGSAKINKGPSYGLAVAEAEFTHDGYTPSLGRAYHSAWMDLQIDHGGVQTLEIGGLNVLNPQLTLNTESEPEMARELNGGGIGGTGESSNPCPGASCLPEF